MKKVMTVNKLKCTRPFLVLLVVAVAALVLFVPAVHSQADGLVQTQVNPGTLPHTTADKSSISNVLDVVFEVGGGISLLMIVIGGFRYITAGSDPGAVGRAKGTITYAIVGLLVMLAGYSIVNLVAKGVS